MALSARGRAASLDPAGSAELLRDTGATARPLTLGDRDRDAWSRLRSRSAFSRWASCWRSSCFAPTHGAAGRCWPLIGLSAFVPLPLHATAWLGALGNAGRAQAFGIRPIIDRAAWGPRSCMRWRHCHGSS